MLLADLDLSALSSEVIHSLISGLQHELTRRNALARMQNNKRPKRKIAHVQERFGFPTYDEEITRLSMLYSSALYALPISARQHKIKHRIQYWPLVFAQDWSALFPQATTEPATYYVYAHSDPRKAPIALTPLECILPGEPFYIGKGSGRRAWDLKRNQGHGKRIARLHNLGYTDASLVTIVANNLTEQAALILEAKLIYFFGSIYDETKRGCLLNLADHMRPTFVQTMLPLPTKGSYGFRLQTMANDVLNQSKNKRNLKAPPANF